MGHAGEQEQPREVRGGGLAARDIAAKCTIRNGSRLLPYINTRNTARDMGVIRGILGERKLSYIGWSYGTYLGAVYTQLFPRHSDRTVLDSAVDPANDNAVGLNWAITCADNTVSWPRDPARYRRDAHREKARHPIYGDFAANITPCAFWPRGAEPATRVDNTAAALVIQNQWDPQTPLSSGRALHRALHGSRLVYIHGGRGHTVYALPGAPARVTRTVDAYLTDGHLPKTDLTCNS
ncbi:alpha/beta hydrolase [Streptomyces sp. NPDC090075]|uniref:alpha/beta hydrolase n=1 Tax=Streptomyces sp. NPDC090075 TaxID=3365937 RepID=UPI0037F8D940